MESPWRRDHLIETKIGNLLEVFCEYEDKAEATWELLCAEANSVNSRPRTGYTFEIVALASTER